MAPYDVEDPLSPEGDTPGQVITILPEDKDSYTVKPRLRAAGADLTKVFSMSTVKLKQAGGGSAQSSFTLPRDFGLLRYAIRQLGDVRWVIMGPLARISSVSIAHPQTVRHEVIEPLQQIAEETGVAIILVMHFNRGSRSKNTNLLDKVQGSMTGIVGSLRVVNAILRDELDPEIRHVVNMAGNLAGPNDNDWPPIEYKITGKSPESYVVYKVQAPDPETASMDRLERWILGQLIDARRPISSNELAAYSGLAHGLVKQILKRAMLDGKIVQHRKAYTIPALPAGMSETPMPEGVHIEGRNGWPE
jgi:hypothetical protein